MISHNPRSCGLRGVQVLFTCLAFFAPIGFSGSSSTSLVSWTQSAQAAPDSGIPSGWESYLDRPDILEVRARSHALRKSWEDLKAAHFSFVAELLALYSPDTHLYFLARDSELLYDVARLVTEGTEDSKRVHLINVSRANMRDANLKAYLKENGISEKTLAAGHKVVFVDTGLTGTIPRVIAENFPKKLRMRLKTHLIVSSNSTHPPSHAFLIHLNPSVNDHGPSSMAGTILDYEHRTRGMDRSQRFVFSQGRYHPVSRVNQNSDGPVSKKIELQFMEDLKATWQRPATRARFQAERAQVEMVKRLMADPTERAKDRIKALLTSDKTNQHENRLLEAQVRDVWAAQVNADLKITWKLEDFGLQPQLNYESSRSKKNELIAKYPEWAPVLEDPETQIPLLVQSQNWQMLGNLIDADVDAEINQIIANSLYDAPATGTKKDLQILMIKKDNTITRQYLASMVFSKPHTKDMADLLRLLIENGDKATLQQVARYTFSQPHTKDMIDLLRLLTEKGDETTLQYLNYNTYTEPHAQTPRHQILRHALGIDDDVQRAAWIDAEWTKLSSHPTLATSIESSIPTQPILPSLQIGDAVFIENREFKVVQKAGENKYVIVFQVQTSDGTLYALEVPKNSDVYTRAYLADEAGNIRQWQNLGIPHPQLFFYHNRFVLKTWISGIPGDRLIEMYVAGNSSLQGAVESLLKLVVKVHKQGIHIGDFRPANLIWTGNDWAIDTAGHALNGMTLAEARAKLSQAVQRSPEVEQQRQMLRPTRCGDLFKNARPAL